MTNKSTPPGPKWGNAPPKSVVTKVGRPGTGLIAPLPFDYFIPWWRVDFLEEEARAASEAILNRRMTMGPLTQEFEGQVAKLLDVPHVVATNSGSSALILALLEAGIGPGDEVIVPNRSWISTANSPRLLGAELVFVDVEPDRPVLDIGAVEAALTERTRAVIPVHLNGWPCDLPRLRALARERGLVIIEDACQALLSASPEGGWLGCHARAGCFSLAIGKMLSSGQGGFIVTHDQKIARRLSIMRTQGAGDVTMARWELAGGNFRFWDLPAAVALTQLSRVEEKMKQVRDVYLFYEKRLAAHPDIELVRRDLSTGQLPLYVDCFCSQRSRLLQFLLDHGIQARPYYQNMSQAPQFSPRPGTGYPHSDRYAQDGLILPCGPDRTLEELEYAAGVLSRFRL